LNDYQKRDFIEHGYKEKYDADDFITELDTQSIKNRQKNMNEKNKNNNNINVDKLIEMCTNKLNIQPLHKKALYIRASSYMKKLKFSNVIKDCN
jgi:hypothetical protein